MGMLRQKNTFVCKGAITTNLQLGDLRCTSRHNYPTNQHVIEACKVKDSLRDMAKKTRDEPSRILAQAVTAIRMTTRLEVGKTVSVKRSLRRHFLFIHLLK